MRTRGSNWIHLNNTNKYINSVVSDANPATIYWLFHLYNIWIHGPEHSLSPRAGAFTESMDRSIHWVHKPEHSLSPRAGAFTESTSRSIHWVHGPEHSLSPRDRQLNESTRQTTNRFHLLSHLYDVFYTLDKTYTPPLTLLFALLKCGFTTNGLGVFILGKYCITSNERGLLYFACTIQSIGGILLFSNSNKASNLIRFATDKYEPSGFLKQMKPSLSFSNLSESAKTSKTERVSMNPGN